MEYHVAEYEDTQIVLECPVCANPLPEYQWYFNGTDSSSKINEAKSENFTVLFANDSSFGVYYCEVTNTVDTVTFPVELRELGRYNIQTLKCFVYKLSELWRAVFKIQRFAMSLPSIPQVNPCPYSENPVPVSEINIVVQHPMKQLCISSLF